MKYEELYKEADKELVLHENDSVLCAIHIPLPDPPKDKSKILNYGLHPDDQKFIHHKMPPRMEKVEVYARRFYNLKESDQITVDHLYNFLEDNKTSWIEEILWIRQMIHYRYHGCWIYIHGKPVYINRWYWFYLNQWDINSETRTDRLPNFTDRDWIWWTASLHLYNDTTSVFQYKIEYQKKKKKTEYFGDKREFLGTYQAYYTRNERAIEENKKLPYPLLKKFEGEFFIDLNTRLVYGLVYPKGRRDGATYRSQSMGYCIVTEAYSRFGGIQSKSDTDSQNVFTEKLIKPFQNLWFFFKPYQDKGIAPKSNINFQKSSHAKNSIGRGEGILGWIEQRPSGSLAFDGEKLHFMHHDEVGKKEKGSVVDVFKRWNVAKKCLSVGDGKKIIGWASLTSTVNKMEKEGGREFFKIAKLSMYDQRNRNGQTSSGLVNLFIPHYVGLEGFIDEYGMTVIEDPEDDVTGVDGVLITHGSKSHILANRRDLELKEEWEALNEAIRQAPIDFSECFKEGNSDSSFNIMKLSDALKNHRLYPEKFPIRCFDLEWVNGTFGAVRLIDNPNGKFKSSWLPPKHLWNKFSFDPMYEYFKPTSPIKLVLGADPVKYGKAKYKKKSNGGLALFYPWDEELDPETKPQENWVSNKFRVTYNEVIYDKKIFVRDALMLCVLTGAKIFPEANIADFHDYFYENGYGGYCLHNVDNMGKASPYAGRVMSDPAKTDLFSGWERYINNHILHEPHEDIIQEAKDVGDPKNMTDYDLFTAGGMALLGADLLNRTFVKDDEEELTDLNDYLIGY
jgi:hypothetical protein